MRGERGCAGCIRASRTASGDPACADCAGRWVNALMSLPEG